MAESLAIIALHTAALHYIFVKVSAFWPAAQRVDISHFSDSIRRRNAKVVDRLHLFIAVMILPLVVWSWHSLFDLVEGLANSSQPDARFLIRPMAGFRWISAICAGFAITGPLALGLLRIILGTRFHEYVACEDRHFGFDGRKLLYVGLVWAIPLSVEWEIHCIDWYARFGDDEVAVSEFWSLGERRFSYLQVERILKVRNFKRSSPGAIFPRAQYAIIFQDGTRWTSADGGNNGINHDAQIVEFVATKSGKKIEEVPSL